MPYVHAGEVGDVWKHLPLCGILKIENPLKYHESNSAYSGYALTVNPKIEYGILKPLRLDDVEAFAIKEAYMEILKLYCGMDMGASMINNKYWSV